MMFDNFIFKLVKKQDLNASEAFKCFKLLFKGLLTFEQAKTLLLLLTAKGESASELEGCLKVLRTLEKPKKVNIPSLMDTCGTGGDFRSTINISTISALVIAGAGGKVSKHGNRAISSKSGSSDFLESFGVSLNMPHSKIVTSIKKFGIGYFHAPNHHPVFKKLHPLRIKLKKRTILNLLGPLVNPLKLEYQLVGVSSEKLLYLYAKTISKTAQKQTLICHSFDGMDEISTAVDTRIALVTPGKIKYGYIKPRKYQLRKALDKDLFAKNKTEAKQIAIKILTNKWRGPATDLIALNAGCGLFVSKKAKNISHGIKLAKESIKSGNAYQALINLKRISRQS